MVDVVSSLIKNSRPLISVIVPVFNVENYLSQCIESILSQTYNNIEIIIVDDGSSDGSSVICDNYKIHDNIKVIHQENRGLSAARNAGVALASGEFIGFVDSDDYISPVYYESLLFALLDSGSQMSTVRHGVTFYDDRPVELCNDVSKAIQYEIMSDIQYQEEILYQKSWPGAVWRLYRRELCDSVSFPNGLYYEDDDTAYKYAHLCRHIAVLREESLYGYRQNNNSIMRGEFNSNKAESALIITRQMHTDLTKWYPPLHYAIDSRCFAILRVVFSQVPESEVDIQNMLWKESQLYTDSILKDPKARVREKIAAFISRFGRKSFRLFCLTYKTLLKCQ